MLLLSAQTHTCTYNHTVYGVYADSDVLPGKLRCCVVAEILHCHILSVEESRVYGDSGGLEENV